MTFGAFAPTTCIYMLAIWECAMGLTLLLAPSHTRWGAIALRLCALSMLLHLAGTFLPLLLFPADTWKHVPYAPTLAGQYILKNLVLMSAALTVATKAAITNPAPQLARKSIVIPISIGTKPGSPRAHSLIR